MPLPLRSSTPSSTPRRRRVLVCATELPSRQRGAALDPEQWLARCDVQFHWRNDADWRVSQDFLDAMVHKRRKAIARSARRSHAWASRQPRRWQTVRPTPLRADARDYCITFDEKGNSARLTLILRHPARSALKRC